MLLKIELKYPFRRKYSEGEIDNAQYTRQKRFCTPGMQHCHKTNEKTHSSKKYHLVNRHSCTPLPTKGFISLKFMLTLACQRDRTDGKLIRYRYHSLSSTHNRDKYPKVVAKKGI